jgi:hypothetical protein
MLVGMSVNRPLSAYLANVAAAVLFALSVTLAALAWLDMVGYAQFTESWANL